MFFLYIRVFLNMLRAAEESFFSHVIPLLLWDDVRKFQNTNRRSLRLVNKRSRDVVGRFRLPTEYIERVVDVYFPLHDAWLWERVIALECLTSMILYNPRRLTVSCPRKTGKSNFLEKFVRLLNVHRASSGPHV